MSCCFIGTLKIFHSYENVAAFLSISLSTLQKTALAAVSVVLSVCCKLSCIEPLVYVILDKGWKHIMTTWFWFVLVWLVQKVGRNNHKVCAV